MDDAQTWTAIIGLLSVMVVGLAAISRLVGSLLERRFADLDTTMVARFELQDARVRAVGESFSAQLSASEERTAAGFAVVNTRLDGLTTTMNDRFDEVDRRFADVDRRFERVETRLDRVETRLDRVETRLDGIDRDITSVTRRLMDGEG